MAVKEYSYKKHKDIYCSAHTKVREMRSKDGADTILISQKLMEAVETLFARLDCGKYVITSGYRTPAHDIRVGGNGKGQHTLGKALDAKFYDKKGKLISAKIVCCVAQDTGLFSGIANISKKYDSVHLDVGTRAKPYLGDEIFGTNSVTDNFYDYFSITSDDVCVAAGEKGYFKKYCGTTVSIVKALGAIGEKSTYSYRAEIATANGISGYKGTAKQNTAMLSLLKEGRLRRP